MTPYDAPTHIGPGTIKLRFKAPAGAPEAGRVDVVAYSLLVEFTRTLGTDPDFVTLHTDLKTSAPSGCSSAQRHQLARS